MKKNALIIVDVQNDFLPNGALGVSQADEILPLINQLIVLPFDVKVASQDWHPPHHCSFASTWGKKHGEQIVIGNVRQTLWKDHCIQDSFGAEFSKALDATHFDYIVHKGLNPNVDSYSTFFDNNKLRETGLEAYLHAKGVKDLYIAGLTTEYCVYYSVLDAVHLGFTAHVILDACRGIELNEGDVATAIKGMQDKGAEFLNTEQVVKRFS